MSGYTYVSSRFEDIESRFEEIDTLLELAKENIHSTNKYQSLCRSAHVLLVSHIEGIYKDVVKDVIDDLNNNTKFYEIKDKIFYTFVGHFINTPINDDNYNKIKEKLWLSFKDYKTDLKQDPFLRVDNKNATPKILEEILSKFGEKNFFKTLKKSRLEIVFENNLKTSEKELKRIKNYLKKGIEVFPYLVDKNYYSNNDEKDKKAGLFEDFLNEFLRDRHSIIHGNTMNNPKNHNEILDSKIKIETLSYAFIICLCSISNPIRFL